MYCKEYLNLLVSEVVCQKLPPTKSSPLDLELPTLLTLSPVNNHSISGHMTCWFQLLISDHMTHVYNFYIVVDIPPSQLLLQISVTWLESHDLLHESSNPFPVSSPSHMTSPGYPSWVYKLPQDSVECAVPWQIYYWPLLLLQPQQQASAEVSLQPDSPAHRLSLPRLLPESIANRDSCLSPQSVCSQSWLQAKLASSLQNFSILELS